MRVKAFFLFSLIFLSVTTVNCFAQTEAEKAEIKTNVDWLWAAAGDAPPSKWGGWLTPVPIGGGLMSIRGPIGARSCGNFAVLFALAGMNNHAVAWLKAAQAHNSHVVDLFGRFPDYTVDYAKNTYKNQALAFGAANAATGGTIQYVREMVAVLKDHKPATEPGGMTTVTVTQGGDEFKNEDRPKNPTQGKQSKTPVQQVPTQGPTQIKKN